MSFINWSNKTNLAWINNKFIGTNLDWFIQWYVLETLPLPPPPKKMNTTYNIYSWWPSNTTCIVTLKVHSHRSMRHSWEDSLKSLKDCCFESCQIYVMWPNQTRLEWLVFLSTFGMYKVIHFLIDFSMSFDCHVYVCYSINLDDYLCKLFCCCYLLNYLYSFVVGIKHGFY